MKFITSFFALLLMFLPSVFSVSGAGLEAASELYVKSGLEKQMQDIGPALLVGYKNNYSKAKEHTAYDKKIYQNIGQVIESSFDVQVMKEKVVTGLRKNITENDMEQILAWLSSPVGQKITELEERAGSKDGVRETQKFIRNIKKADVSTERVRLIKELNSSMDIIETTVDIALSTQFALSMTTGKEKKKLSRDDVLKLDVDFKKNRSRIEPMIKHQVHGSLLYTYQALSDEELGEFVAFAKSKNGKNYTRATSSVLIQTIDESSLQFAWEISQL